VHSIDKEDRMKHRLVTLVLVLAAATACAKEHRVVVRDAGEDRAVAGGSFAQTAPVGGDLMAAGGRVDVRAEVGGDALLAGGKVRTMAPVKQSLYAAGGNVTIDAPVERNARIAGGTLEVTPQGRVDGNVSAAGGTLRVRGPIGGYLMVGAGQVLIDAPVAGDVDVRAGHLTLGPRAAIAGKLRYGSREAIERDPAAQVAGGIELLEARTSGEPRHRAARALGWLWSASLVLLAALLAALLPRGYDRVRQALEQRPGMSVLAGIGAIVCIPAASILLLVTVVGIPVGLLALLLYPALLLLGYVSAAVAGGRMALAHWWPARQSSRGWQALAAAVCMGLVCVAATVPWFGRLVAVAVLLFGVGALLLAWRPAPPQPAATA
jgi:hypothetical protein